MKWLGLTAHSENVYGILVGKLERIDDLEDLEIGGSIILKLALEK